MPGLSCELVEHRLPIKHGFRTHKQHMCSFNSIIYNCTKEGINQLLEADFFKPCKYVAWVSNIVPIEKKDIEKL